METGETENEKLNRDKIYLEFNTDENVKYNVRMIGNIVDDIKENMEINEDVTDINVIHSNNEKDVIQ